MVQVDTTTIIHLARDLFFKKGVDKVSIAELCREVDMSEAEFENYFSGKEELVDKILELERKSFEEIFEKYDFDGVNSIEILLIVGSEINKKFKYVSPSFTFDIKKYYPQLYAKHIQNREEFIYEQMVLNIEKGIRMGMYRNDISVELIARSYISRLMGLHNEKDFPPEIFTFAMLWDVMFDQFIQSIATQDGIQYYKQRKLFYNIYNLQQQFNS